MALVLTREAGRDAHDTIRIGDDITVTVSHIRGNQVRVSIEAPREVPIFREEIARRMVGPSKKTA